MVQQYNPNDFYPRTGQEVKSDGTTVNEADGINADGSENVVLSGTNIVLLASNTNATVAANTTAEFLASTDVSKYAFYSVQVSRDNSHSFSVLEYSHNTVDQTLITGTTVISTTTNNAVLRPLKPTSPSIGIAINNQDTTNPHTYKVYLYGYKM